MPGAVIFTASEERFPTALARFDPLAGDPILRFFDPEARAERGWQGWWQLFRRLFWLWLVLVVFIVLAVLSDAPLLGHDFWGPTGLARDFGAWHQYVGLLAWWCSVLVGRRVLALLVKELEGDGVAPQLGSRLRSLSPRSRTLRRLEWLSRPGSVRSWIWLLTLSLFSFWALATFLRDGIANWITFPATPGTLLFGLRIGGEQPTLSGLVSIVVVGVLNEYAAFLAARLFVMFGVVCEAVGKADDLRIIPTHPDGAGGLLPVGKVSLFFSLFTVQAGLAIVINMIQSYVRLRTAGSEVSAAADMIPLNLTGLGLYILLGPLLFFLPLMPLRRVMGREKRRQLLQVEALVCVVQREYASDLELRRLRPDMLQGLAALNELYSAGQQMTVWPFDRQTFLRFAGALLTPLLPLLTAQTGTILDGIRRFFFPVVP